MAKRKKENQLNNVKLLDSEENLEIPNICKFIRETLKVTQLQMAEKLSVSLRAYRDWEYGKYVPKSWQAINLGVLYTYAKERKLEQDLEEQTSQNASENQAA